MDVAGRADRLRALLDDERVDALLVTDSPTSATSPGSPARPALLVVDRRRARPRHRRPLRRAGRRAARARPASRPASRSPAPSSAQVVTEAARRRRRRIGLEADHVTWARAARATPRSGSPTRELVPTSGLVERLRASRTTARSPASRPPPRSPTPRWPSCGPGCSTGPPRRSSRSSSTPTMRRLGATGPASRPSSASGPNGAKPHARPVEPSGRADGDLVVLDFGALVDGYRSDMTRTVAVGEVDRHAAAHARGRRPRPRRPGSPRSRPGVAAVDVDAACREVIDEAGWGEAFLPRHRPRRRPRHPRGPPGGARRAMLRSPPATWSPSSRASTSPSTAASASRTPSSSPPTAAAPSPTRTKDPAALAGHGRGHRPGTARGMT